MPRDLAELTPGSRLAALLETVDESQLNGHDLVTLLRAQSRQVAHLQAKMYSTMAAIAHCPSGDAEADAVRLDERVEFAADEIRAALTWTRRKAESELDCALRLTSVLRKSLQAMHDGRLDAARVWKIDAGTAGLDDDGARAAEANVLDYAVTHTTGQVGAKLRRLIVRLDPDAARKRYDDALEDRRVGTELNDDGTGNIYALNLPIDKAATARARIEAFARAARMAGDTRTMDQVRADVFLDVLLGGYDGRSAPANTSSVVQITIPIDTLTKASEAPGELAGWGPVVADVARQFVRDRASGEWRWAVLDPATGRVLGADVTRRRPTAQQRRIVEANSPHCAFVGCRMPAVHSDIDHVVRHHDGGPTVEDNLNPVCRHDHRLKDEGGWKVDQLRPGVLEWTSPLGHTYVVETDPLDDGEPLARASGPHRPHRPHRPPRPDSTAAGSPRDRTVPVDVRPVPVDVRPVHEPTRRPTSVPTG